MRKALLFSAALLAVGTMKAQTAKDNGYTVIPAPEIGVSNHVFCFA